MLFDYNLSTHRKDFYNITPQIREAVSSSGVESGGIKDEEKIKKAINAVRRIL